MLWMTWKFKAFNHLTIAKAVRLNKAEEKQGVERGKKCDMPPMLDDRLKVILALLYWIFTFDSKFHCYTVNAINLLTLFPCRLIFTGRVLHLVALSLLFNQTICIALFWLQVIFRIRNILLLVVISSSRPCPPSWCKCVGHVYLRVFGYTWLLLLWPLWAIRVLQTEGSASSAAVRMKLIAAISRPISPTASLNVASWPLNIMLIKVYWDDCPGHMILSIKVSLNLPPWRDFLNHHLTGHCCLPTWRGSTLQSFTGSDVKETFECQMFYYCRITAETQTLCHCMSLQL